MTIQQKIGNGLKLLRYKTGIFNVENYIKEMNIPVSVGTMRSYENGKGIQLDTLIEILNAHKITLYRFIQSVK